MTDLTSGEKKERKEKRMKNKKKRRKSTLFRANETDTAKCITFGVKDGTSGDELTVPACHRSYICIVSSTSKRCKLPLQRTRKVFSHGETPFWAFFCRVALFRYFVSYLFLAIACIGIYGRVKRHGEWDRDDGRGKRRLMVRDTVLFMYIYVCIDGGSACNVWQMGAKRKPQSYHWLCKHTIKR